MIADGFALLRRSDSTAVRRHWEKLKIPPCSEVGLYGILSITFWNTGLWRNWLAHWTVDPGVAGSSPVDPASTEGHNEIASWCNGSTADSDSACWGSSPCEATIAKGTQSNG